ncbi:membrane-associated phosphatidylinositol transfer protein 2 isoform X1 [Hemicordylus capensis]|uniref:membrane-associated phosphatidylinositol transfer protein 2 isoform X1 n=1 Tax=Hemicordylus capensis TaxID=884348 RepID=UPI0023026624|nr:membrane-associated phosphatidylinositol transfer protein 2 isoform X1 [Hemicordylus capensis]XP_053136087.1 membrane-associated phosphatidylinositol transfer protein 2 isoform X1 [Hemicordylus capensis]XP_053136088.1 membrane-associated phosphatidylinositol transfer protein 2 isoform X1 [Hemicordylus capensis]XP_053136089.1 membrane-associated phosphatidylinositol transfer protein 2 isoform X1 [Hemicordylus capensis]XP_053136091.1 membrane-associated phosphatidylinositol transfer protein 2 
MLIKEYRIPLPMSVDEYRIAQLYMIQKKSREETCGEGSGVEILENRPYRDGPGGNGQYTHKVYHIGMHIPSWFRSILPKAALRVEEESWNAYPYTRTRYTCPFVEKFSIDIETYYIADSGEQVNVFNLSPAEKRQTVLDPIDIVKDPIPPHEYKSEEDPKMYRSVKTTRGPLSEDWIKEHKSSPGRYPIMCAYKLCKVEFRYWGMQSKIERFIHDVGLRKVMVRAHRQAWCWQDEWYGLTIEDIRQLEKEAQLMLAQKMAQFSCNENEVEPHLPNDPLSENDVETKAISPSTETVDSASNISETLSGRVLTKQWSTSSKSSSKRGTSPSRHSISEWRMQSIARDSDESSDDEFFDAHEDLSENEEVFPKEITKWSSNDLMDKIETPESEEVPDDPCLESAAEYNVGSSVERLGIIEDEVVPLLVQPSKIHVLLLVLHGGNILDTGSGDQSSKQGDVNTIATAFDTVIRVHYPVALGRIAIKLVPCPAICSEAFSLVSNLSPYSYDEGCLSNSQDHIPLAALPLLATSSPQYQEAVATVILRANQVYSEFIKSQEGTSFSGQVCLVGDCVGGILAFDALCYSNQATSESQNSSRRGSVVSVQDTDLLSPGIIVNNSYCSGGSSSLEASRHLSRSNIDIPRSNGEESKKLPLRKTSDSSTYELDTIKQHQAFLSSLHSSVLRNYPGSRRSSSSTVLDGGNLGKFEFEITDFFLFGSPLGLVLALRKTVVPTLDVFQLRPACQQVYNLFHPADPSASRLEPLLEKKFHILPPFSIPRYQRFPLGDGNSALLVETVQSNPLLLVESSPLVALQNQDSFVETSIPVPILNWQDASSKNFGFAESDVVQSHGGIFMENTSPSAPISAPQFRGFRRASETSIASQVSGMADSYTASNVANIAAKWWGTKRIDYALYCPDALTAFPTVALPHLFHASYWESTDVVSFLLRQVMRHENSSILELDGKEVSVFTPSKPREKWLRKRTHVKLRNVTANHRINDAIVNEDGPQMLAGRFMYGPLDMVTLTGEKVDIHIMTQPPSGEWVYFDTEVSNSSGRISYSIPENRRLGIGVYPVKMVVRGDHTYADSYITVLPKGTEFVVFSIDGSFAASVSIMGSDPKVRAGAVDVVRHWQDLGYLIIYVTGRPDMQKQRVVAWLAQHNFPHGIVSFCDGLVHDPLRHKANFLKSLLTDLHMKIHAAYGSTKDISVYTSISLPPSQIYIVGRPTKKLQNQCQFITEGYASHLAQLEYTHRSRPAKNTTRMALRKGSFGLPGQAEFLRKRNHLLRTISSQPPAAGGSASHRPERTQSQSESERERERGQRSMSLATGCWGRSAASRLEPGTLGQK